MSTDESRDVERLVARLRELGRLEAQPAWGRASAHYDHIGAKLADAVLQSGVGYEVFVRPRVDRIAATWPNAQTISGFLLLLDSEGPAKVFDLKSGRKLRTIVELAQFLRDSGVETTTDLWSWLQVAGNPLLLMTVHGVGPKTVSFLKLLVGLDAIAVDRQVLRFVQEAGVDLKAPDLVEAILTKAGKQLGLSGEQVDQLVWRSMAARDRRVATSLPTTRNRMKKTKPKTSTKKPKKKPSEYERKAILAIHEWKNPKLGWFDKTMEVVNWPFSKAGVAIKKVPGVQWTLDKGTPPLEWVLQKTVGGLVTLLNDGAQWSISPKGIYADFAKSGIQISSNHDILALDLEQIDRVLGWLDVKYKTIAFAEGGGTGAVGLPGIPIDVVAIVGINLRAIGEYATYCGFDIATQPGRLFAMNVLTYASSPTDSAKQAALAQLVRIAKDVAAKKAWKDLEKHSFVLIVKKIAGSLGERLTKAKLAQMIPYLGAGIGAGFNAYFTAKVCDAAFFLYRERFLAEKYGPKIIEATVKAAKTLDPDY